MTSNIDNSPIIGEAITKESTTPGLAPPQNSHEIPAVSTGFDATTTASTATTTTTVTAIDTVEAACTLTTSSEPSQAPTSTLTTITTAPAIIIANDTVTVPVDDTNASYDFTDTGIFDFMKPEMAIELYQRIHSRGVPDLDWKFYGRRKPNDPSESDGKGNRCDSFDGTPSKDQQEQDTSDNTLNNTEFDFDESFSELRAETSTVSDSLKLKNRPEPGSERKTNLSDIMSDILKETSHIDYE